MSAALAMTSCKRRDEHASSESAPATKSTATASNPAREAKRPWPAGKLIHGPVSLVFAVYALPGGTADVLAAARAAHGGLATLTLIEEGEMSFAATTLRLTTPAMKDFAPPDAGNLAFVGRGLSEAEVAAVQHSPQVVVMTFNAPAKHARRMHRDALALVDEVAKTSGGLIWDDATGELFAREAFARRLAKPVDDLKNLPAHFTICVSDARGGLVRLVSHGLEKLGLSNLVVENVTRSSSSSMISVLNAVAATMYRDGKLAKTGELTVTNAVVDAEALDSAKGAATVHLVEGTAQEGDPRGRLIEIAFPGPAAALHERQEQTIDALFGSSDEMDYVAHSAAVLEASAAAKATLLKLKPRFIAGLPDLETLLVKAPFATSDGGREWMWVEVMRWKGTTIHGVLRNDPFHVPDLAAGAKVDVEESDILDYIHNKSDGTSDGNETAKLLRP